MTRPPVSRALAAGAKELRIEGPSMLGGRAQVVCSPLLGLTLESARGRGGSASAGLGLLLRSGRPWLRQAPGGTAPVGARTPRMIGGRDGRARLALTDEESLACSTEGAPDAVATWGESARAPAVLDGRSAKHGRHFRTGCAQSSTEGAPVVQSGRARLVRARRRP